MPLLKPEIQAALREVGLAKEGATLPDKLDNAGLSLDNLLQELRDTIGGAGNEATRMRALETGLKLHGALKEQAASQIPQVTIVIADPQTAASQAVNPILLPRSASKTTVEETIN